MKVAFLIERFDPQRGGMETSAAEFLTEIAALGHEMHIVTQTSPGTFGPARVETLGVAGWGRAGRYRQFVRGAERYLSRSRWDVVHAVTPCLACDLYQPRSGTAQESLARTIAVRRHWAARAARRWAAWFNRKERLLARLEDSLLGGSQPPLVAALSSYMKRQILQAYPLPPERVRDVFNGVTMPLPSAEERMALRNELRRQVGWADSDLVAIFVGNNFRRKGLPRLLEALALPPAAAWKLLVVGKDNSTAYQRQATELQLAARVQFLGARADVRSWYLAADTAVLPSYYDPCSRTILEALSLGLPVIASRYDGSSDCVQPGRHGFIVETPENVPALAQALADLAIPAARQRMAAAALELRPYLSMRRHAEQISALYQELGKAKPQT